MHAKGSRNFPQYEIADLLTQRLPPTPGVPRDPNKSREIKCGNFTALYFEMRNYRHGLKCSFEKV